MQGHKLAFTIVFAEFCFKMTYDIFSLGGLTEVIAPGPGPDQRNSHLTRNLTTQAKTATTERTGKSPSARKRIRNKSAQRDTRAQSIGRTVPQCLKEKGLFLQGEGRSCPAMQTEGLALCHLRDTLPGGTGLDLSEKVGCLLPLGIPGLIPVPRAGPIPAATPHHTGSSDRPQGQGAGHGLEADLHPGQDQGQGHLLCQGLEAGLGLDPGLHPDQGTEEGPYQEREGGVCPELLGKQR